MALRVDAVGTALIERRPVKVVEGLGYPVYEDAPPQPLDQTDLVKELEEHRDTYYPDWCRERGIFNFAILVARGFFRGTS